MESRPGLSPANAPAATGPAGRLVSSIGRGALVDPSPGRWFTAPLDGGRLLDCAAVGRRSNLWRHAVALLVTVLFVAPLVLMVSGSLREAGLPPPRVPELVPSPLAFENYSRAFELVDIPRYALNSLIVAAIAVPLSVLVASWAGFAMARLPRRQANALVAVSLIALMVPLTALLVPRFTLFRTLGLTDTYVPLVAPALLGMSPFYVLLYYWAFRRVPPELFDAARLEGLSAFAAWRRVAMPLVRPVTVAVAATAPARSSGKFKRSSWARDLRPSGRVNSRSSYK